MTVPSQVWRRETPGAQQEDPQVQYIWLCSNTSQLPSVRGCVIDSCVLSGVDGETLSPGADSVFDPAEGEGSNLVVSRPSVLTQEPTLLDLPRDSVDRDVFESYTYTGTLLRKLTHTHWFSLPLFISVFSCLSFSLSIFTGISSPSVSLRPFSLRPGSRYMLEVTARESLSYQQRQFW